MTVFGEVRAALGRRGWDGAIIPASRAVEVRRLFEDWRDRGVLDPAFYAVELTDTFAWDPSSVLPAPESIIITARPAPLWRLTFHLEPGPQVVLIPPTYVRGVRMRRDAEEVVAAALAPRGFRIARAVLPEKTLAVRSGLARYGRNNVTYVPGMGSFLRLAAMWSDLPASEDPWREPVTLDRCTGCSACTRACPTGAIRDDRFLLHGEVCLTHLNEQDVPFPAWLDPGAHNALIGCMRCQTACPENRDVLDRVEDGPSFDLRETSLLAAAFPIEELPAGTMEKMETLEIGWDYEVLCRNLAAVLGAAAA